MMIASPSGPKLECEFTRMHFPNLMRVLDILRGLYSIRSLYSIGEGGPSKKLRTARSWSLLRISVLAATVLASPRPGSAQWPGLGGPNRDFKSTSSDLADSWPETGPPILWSRSVGDAYSSIAVDDGLLFTMSSSESSESVLAINRKTGELRWRFDYPRTEYDGLSRQFGEGPNATPLIHGDLVYAVGLGGQLFCLERETGKQRWSHDLLGEFGATALVWGYSTSPIVAGDRLIVLAGGKGASVIAFSLNDGKVLWKRHDFANGYSSAVLIQCHGQDQIIAFMATAVLALNPKNGNLAWTFDHKTEYGINAFTPIWSDRDSTLFISSGYDKGSRMLKLMPTESEEQVEQLWYTKRLKIQFGNGVRVANTIYFSSGHSGQGFLAAVRADNGAILWKKSGYHRASLIYGDGKFFILDETGRLILANLSPESCEKISSIKLLSHVSWSTPALAGNTLYIRDRETLVALDVGN